MWSHSRFTIGVWFLAIAGFPALVRALPPAPPSLGAAASFAVLGGSAVTSSGATIVTGNLGVSPGNTITGFLPGAVKVGATFRNDSTAAQAQRDTAAAYAALAGRGCDSGSIGGTPAANITYCVSSFALTEPVTLAANNPDDVWIFNITGPLTSDPNAAVLLTNGAKASNVFWRVGGSVTLAEGTVFVGTVLALGDITLRNGASVSGRLLAGGAVAL